MLGWMKKKAKEEGKKAKVIFVGLDAAGKTSILNYYEGLESASDTQPTLGANVEEIKFGDLHIVATDIGGQKNFRGIWSNFYQGTDLIVYVVDAADKTRIPEAREELHKALNNKALKAVPLIIYLNKQDMPEALTEGESIVVLGIHEIKDRSWNLVATSAIDGRGLAQGFQWMYETIMGKKLERDITLHEIYVFNKGGVTLAHLSDAQGEKADPLMVTGLLSAIQSMGEEVFSESMRSLKTQNLKIVFAATEELAGALVVDINDDENLVQKVLQEVLHTVEKEGPDKAKEKLKELIQTWGIHVEAMI